MDRGLVLVLRELSEADAAEVFPRLAGLRGIDAMMPNEVCLSDAVVAEIARIGSGAELVRAAANPRLTASQLCRLIEAGGAAVVAGAFPPDVESPGGAAPAGGSPAGAGGEGSVDAASPDEDSPDEDSTDVLDRARAELRRPGTSAERAVELLRAHPVLAHTARQAGSVRLLHSPGAPMTRTEALDQAGSALRAGVLAPREILLRMRPARVAAQVLAVVAREHAYVTGEMAVHELLRPAIVDTLGTSSGAWAHLARALGRFAGTLPELFAESAAHTGEAAIRVPAAVRPSVGFLLRRLDEDELTSLIPHLDDATAVALLPGNVPPLTHVAEAALRCGHRALLAALAEHQHVGRQYATRLRDLGDDGLDLLLVDNDSGVTAELRREIYTGRRPGRPLAPMHPDLRTRLLEAPAYSAEYEAMARSGDPAVVDFALPRCEARKLRRIDWIDVVLNLWERADSRVAHDVFTRHRDLFPDRIRATAEAALTAEDPAPLRELRAKWDRGPRAEPPVPDHRRPPGERLRDSPLEQWHSWLVAAASDGDVDCEEIVHHARPVRFALAALASIDANHWSKAAPRPALAQLAKRIGPNPEAWVVFTTLTPDFEGTLTELADVCAAAAG
ncbi:hypothetical protein B4N89_08600 [Embleya scabrispora]|uniref:Uncharacterized protein n=1 Tax=Embleya scabrispora TaxID=159449 RepID=A0A1T3NVX6_9ACTN|nr:hypothetical protein [Embleya scabrispora]OPC80997.1 hypothetical protein B4N89_08600 [Embleya scabrispora]